MKRIDVCTWYLEDDGGCECEWCEDERRAAWVLIEKAVVEDGGKG